MDELSAVGVWNDHSAVLPGITTEADPGTSP